MLEQIVTIFNRDCRLNKNKPILVGVSGGADSLCLLDLLHRSGYLVVAAHLNHGIRPEANQDALTVQVFAESLGIPVILGEDSVPDHARKYHLSWEESARILRYKFLFDQAKVQNA